MPVADRLSSARPPAAGEWSVSARPEVKCGKFLKNLCVRSPGDGDAASCRVCAIAVQYLPLSTPCRVSVADGCGGQHHAGICGQRSSRVVPARCREGVGRDAAVCMRQAGLGVCKPRAQGSPPTDPVKDARRSLPACLMAWCDACEFISGGQRRRGEIASASPQGKARRRRGSTEIPERTRAAETHRTRSTARGARSGIPGVRIARARGPAEPGALQPCKRCLLSA